MTCSPGALGDMIIKTGSGSLDYTTGAVGTDRWPVEFSSESLKQTTTRSGGDTIRGTLARQIGTSRVTQYSVEGSITLPLSYYYLEMFLKDLFWGGQLLSVTTAGASPTTTFGVLIKRSSSVIYEYTSCVINSLKISGSAGSLCELEVGIIGKREYTSSTNPAAPAWPGTNIWLGHAEPTMPPIAFADVSLGITGVTSIQDFTLSMTRNYETRFQNSLYATDLCPMDQEMTVEFSSTEADLHAALHADSKNPPGQDMTFTFTDVGGNISVLGFSYVLPRGEATGIQGRSSVMYKFMGDARAGSSGGFALAEAVAAFTPAG